MCHKLGTLLKILQRRDFFIRTVVKRSYLIPQAFLESRIPLIYTVDDNTVHSTATHSFAPPLHLPDRVPFQISLDSELPCKIHALSELLSSDSDDTTGLK